MNHQRPDLPRRIGAAIAALVLVPALLSGCEAEAVELVREIEAARGDCTPEGLRVSDEECVRMMERYTSMGTDLVHTYLGGLKALDLALDRMPPPAFDTAGVGYAISPAFRRGDPMGSGGSPRLAPARAAYSYGYGPASPATDAARWSDDPRSRRAAASAATRGAPRQPSAWREGDRRGMDRAGRYTPDRYRGYPDGAWRGGSGSYAPFGLGGYAPFSDGRYSPFGYGYDRAYGYGFDPGYGYGFDPGYGYGYDPNYGYDRSGGYPFGGGYDPYGYGPYGYDPYGYDAYAGRGGYAPGSGWGSAPYGPYDPYRSDPYAAPYAYESDGRYPAPRGAGGYDDLPPESAWGYDPPLDLSATPVDPDGSAAAYDDQSSAPEPRSAAPARPAPHRPGILPPPEERLRRPWLND